MLKVVVKVVLELALVGCEIALCKGIDIEEVFASEKVVNHLVVLGTVDFAVEAAAKGDIV